MNNELNTCHLEFQSKLQLCACLVLENNPFSFRFLPLFVVSLVKNTSFDNCLRTEIFTIFIWHFLLDVGPDKNPRGIL